MPRSIALNPLSVLIALTPVTLLAQEMEMDQPAPKPQVTKPEAKKPEAKKPEAKTPEAKTPAPKPPALSDAKPKKQAKKAKRAKAKARKKARKKAQRSPFGNPEQVIKELELEGEAAQIARTSLNTLVTTQRQVYQEQRKKIGQAYQQFFHAMKKTLTPEQYKQLLAMRRNKRKGKKKAKANKNKQKGKQSRGKRGKRRGWRGLNPQLALRTIQATPEEAAVLTPLLESVLSARQLLDAEKGRRIANLRRQMKKTTDEVALGKLLAKYRVAQQDADATLKKHEQQLVEVLTPAQEMKLVALGVLR